MGGAYNTQRAYALSPGEGRAPRTYVPIMNATTITGDFFDHSRRKKRILLTGQKKDRFQGRLQIAVQLIHSVFIIEIRNSSNAPDNGRGSPVSGKFHQKAFKGIQVIQEQ